MESGPHVSDLLSVDECVDPLQASHRRFVFSSNSESS